jgi:hypothetical protein
MISTQTLTLLQLAIVLMGMALLWLWPRRAGIMVVGILVTCFAATGLSDSANWRSYVDPMLFMLALAVVLRIWTWVVEARRR